MLEERWKAFLFEFHNAEKEPKLLQHHLPKCSINASIFNSYDDEKTRFKESKPVWIEALNMWLSPAKALVFEKCWGELILGHRIFSSDPAPHIQRCSHCKLTGLSEEMRNEMLKKNALDAQQRLKRFRGAFKQRELEEINEVNARLAAFKKAVRDSVDKFTNRGKLPQIYESTTSLDSQHIRKTKKNKATTGKKRSHKHGDLPLILTRHDEKCLSGSHHSRSFSKISESNSNRSRSPASTISVFYSFEEARIDEELRLLEGMENSDSISIGTSPPLSPVILPDWVQVFLNNKSKAKEAIEATNQLQQKDMPIPVWVESVNEAGDVTVTAAEISLPPYSNARTLDYTGSLMAKKAPYPIGIESREVSNMQITASSEQSPYHKAYQARLNNTPKGKNIGAWCPKKHDNCQWLQVDIGRIRRIQQIATQGMPLASVRRPRDKRWVEVFALSYSDDAEKWQYFLDENGNPKLFIANSDLVNTAKNSFVNGLKTRYVRIHPVSWNAGIALRIEIYVEREEINGNDDVTPDQKVENGSVDDILNSETGSYFSEEPSEEESDSASEYLFTDHVEDSFLAEDAQIMSHPEQMSAEETQAATALNASVYDSMHTGSTARLSSIRGTVGRSETVDEGVNQEGHNSEADGASKSADSHPIKSNNKLQRRIEESLLEQQKAEKRQVTFRSVVQRLMSIPNSSTGLTFDDGTDKDDFLSKYCILKDSQKILYSRIFQKFDHDCDGLIEKADLVLGLKALNITSLKEAEMNYIMKIVDVFEEISDDGIDQKAFNVVAAFSERLKNVDSFTRGVIRGTTFDTLYLHAHRTRDLFERMLERGESTISAEQFLIELEAGGVKSEGQNLVRKYADGKKFLDFLDFAIYFPLFLYTHEQIMSTPL